MSGDLRVVGEDGNLIRTIKRRPNRNWLETVHGIGIAPDGGVAIGSRGSVRPAFTKPAINLYGPKGKPIRTIPLPFDGYIFRIAYNGNFIVLSREADLLILDAGGKVIRRFAPTETQRDKPYWQPFFSPDGAELWLCEQGSRTIHRYQAPQLGSAGAKSP